VLGDVVVEDVGVDEATTVICLDGNVRGVSAPVDDCCRACGGCVGEPVEWVRICKVHIRNQQHIRNERDLLHKQSKGISRAKE